MEWAKEFLEAYRYLVYSALLVLLSVFIIIRWWDNVKFWWMCTWMKFPLIGKIATLSKDIESIDDKNWFYSESIVCGDFYSYYNKYNKDATLYENSKSYLAKSDETGRKPFPFYMWLAISFLVLVEALGFGYVLAGWSIPGASEAMQQWGAFLLAGALAILLVTLTHRAGHEIYENSLIKKVRIWHFSDKNNEEKKLISNNKVTLESDHLDDNEPNSLQLLNRIKTNATVTPSWIMTIITAIFIVIVAIGATYIRGTVLEKQLGAEVSNKQTNIFSPLPSELTKIQQAADDKVLKDGQDSDRKGGWATFIVLAVIFIFIQLLGIMFGYRFGFAGRESENAYKNCSLFPSKQEFINHYKSEKEKIAKIAQQNLQELQQRMAQRSFATSISSERIELLKNIEKRTFLTYARMKNEETLQHDIADNASTKKRSEMASEKSPEVHSNEAKKLQLTCSKCGSTVSETEKFCSNCGTPSKKIGKPTCPECGKTYSEGTKFCADDGKSLELR